MTALTKVLARFGATLILGATAILPHAITTHASGSRPLLQTDFFGISGSTTYLVNNANAVIAGMKYARAVEIHTCSSASVSINTHRLAGYRAVSFVLGKEDLDTSGAVLTLVVTADGNQVYTKPVRQGTFTTVVIPFGKAEVLTFTVSEPLSAPCGTLLLANPVALPANQQPPTGSTAQQPPTSSGQITLQLFSAAVSAGGQETALVTASKNAQVAIIIDYPNGTQTVLGPKQAGPDGHLAEMWTIPGTVHGKVIVTAVAGGKVAQGSFTVG